MLAPPPCSHPPFLKTPLALAKSHSEIAFSLRDSILCSSIRSAKKEDRSGRPRGGPQRCSPVAPRRVTVSGVSINEKISHEIDRDKSLVIWVYALCSVSLLSSSLQGSDGALENVYQLSGSQQINFVSIARAKVLSKDTCAVHFSHACSSKEASLCERAQLGARTQRNLKNKRLPDQLQSDSGTVTTDEKSVGQNLVTRNVQCYQTIFAFKASRAALPLPPSLPLNAWTMFTTLNSHGACTRGMPAWRRTRPQSICSI
eukprot:2277117-Pleurochrysis_carterae.AAC.2